MTHRERVLKALNHEEPDRVPIDIGGTLCTGIMAVAYNKLRKHLGIDDKPVKLFDTGQQLAWIEGIGGHIPYFFYFFYFFKSLPQVVERRLRDPLLSGRSP